MPITAIRKFLELEAAGGILLVLAALVAMVLANSPGSPLYSGFLATPVAVQVGALAIAKPLLLWINDGLMAVFFLLVGLEIKREMLEGELSSLSSAGLPAIAALGGMIMPAAVYLAINWGNPATTAGWAIPAATDIAFALGVLALLGTRAPASLKLFLLALAIMDDLGAIVIIALFYTADLSLAALGLAGVGLAVLFAMNRMGVTRIAAYVLVGVFLWVCVLKSGVHATLAGVATAFAIPLRTAGGERQASPLHHLEHTLHPWVAFGILPLFAFANAGVPLTGLTPASLLAPVPLGIALGLFLGKQIGVMGFTWVAIRLGLGRLPEGASWVQFYGMSLLTGIGFTMSLFIGGLAFSGDEYAAAVRIGVLSGSILCAVAGYLVLHLASARSARSARPGDVLRQGAAGTDD
ncbi:Na+/H+ antiporter NhaA [Azospirillum thermophilum]|uniref:Na(+)/H(+) antiporter NhaA n=1 Tax=Azospirillum thermophilum TaxID=2202148 RepID=A0A2S2CPS3_9PROT|nr:Na+/H+ antiporter NhaA [Azospirillum thermophilum]AWK86501.1 Na+/H+ antiporter NhaA [Azospirillum thermophilum]